MDRRRFKSPANRQRPTVGRTNSFRNPENGNSTIFLLPSSSGAVPTVKASLGNAGKSKTHLSSSVLQNLNDTVSSTGNLTFMAQSSDSDEETEWNWTYNDYLQALMKQQIVQKNIKKYNTIVNSQFTTVTNNLHKCHVKLKHTCNEIQSLEDRRSIFELSQMVEWGIKEMELPFSKFRILDCASQLNFILTKHSHLVGVHKIRPINSQDEYDKLVISIKNFESVLDRIENKCTDFEGVYKLASLMKSSAEQRELLCKTIEIINSLNEEAAMIFLGQLSDAFAEQSRCL